MYYMASNLLKAGVPIDRVGIQSHITNNKMLDKEAFNKDNIQNYPMYKTIQAYQKLGLKVRIIEMDVLLYEDKLSSPKEEQLKKQANTYSNYLLSCMLSSNCTGFSVWNISDNHIWYGDNVPGKMENYHPNIFNRNYKPKPAYFALLKTLQDN